MMKIYKAKLPILPTEEELKLLVDGLEEAEIGQLTELNSMEELANFFGPQKEEKKKQ